MRSEWRELVVVGFFAATTCDCTSSAPARSGAPTLRPVAWEVEVPGLDSSDRWTNYPSPAIDDQGTIYVASDNTLIAVLPSSTVSWTVTEKRNAGGFGLVTIGDDGTVYWRAANYVSAYTPRAERREGPALWRGVATGPDGWIGTAEEPPVVGADGTVYTHEDNFTLCARTGGEVLWRFRSKGQLGVPALSADGVVYVGTRRHGTEFYAIDARTGKVKWTFETGRDIDTTPALAQNGSIYLGSADGRLYAVAPTGAEQWRVEVGHPVGSPTIGSDGTIYFVSGDGRLRAVVDPGNGGLMTGGWPKAGADLRNTYGARS